MKTDAYFLENFSGIIISSITTLLSFFYLNQYDFGESIFLDKSIDVGVSAFGFLLAVLALIVQSNSPTINNLKKHSTFIKLIKFNRRAVLLSASYTIYSLLMISINNNISLECELLKKILFDIYVFFFTWMCIEVLIFLRIFYLILLKEAIDNKQ